MANNNLGEEHIARLGPIEERPSLVVGVVAALLLMPILLIVAALSIPFTFFGRPILRFLMCHFANCFGVEVCTLFGVRGRGTWYGHAARTSLPYIARLIAS